MSGGDPHRNPPPGGGSLSGPRVVASSGSDGALLRAALELRPRLAECARRVLQDAEEAEDVAQEALIRLGRARLNDPGAARAWLLATTWRLAIDRTRARRRREGLTRGAPAPAPVEPTVEAAARRDEARRALSALETLDEPYRTALRLRCVEGRDFPEVARRMNALERTARTWVARGLTRLREQLGPGGSA